MQVRLRRTRLGCAGAASKSVSAQTHLETSTVSSSASNLADYGTEVAGCVGRALPTHARGVSPINSTIHKNKPT